MIRCWIPYLGVIHSKPQHGSKVDLDFHPSEVNHMSSENSRVLVVKSKLSLRSGSATLTQLNPINEK